MALTCVFPGQGSQYKGMGDGLFQRFPGITDQANEVLGYSVENLCLKDPDKKLSFTQYTQPALYTVNALQYFSFLEDTGLAPSYVAGHSLGEFNALLAAGAYDFSTGLKLVKKRGELMSAASQGAMAAVLGIAIERVRELINEAGLEQLQIANINSPTQTIISGKLESVERAADIFTPLGVKFVRLNVSAAFHSVLMKDAKRIFMEFIKEKSFKDLQLDVISNLTARPYPQKDYQNLIIDQITGTVNWYESISWLQRDEEMRFIEVGPGQVLTKLLREIRKAPFHITENDGEVYKAKHFKPNKKDTNLVFIYGTAYSLYADLAKDLILKRTRFYEAIKICSDQFKNILGFSVADVLINSKHETLVKDIEKLLPISFSVQYALSLELRDRGYSPSKIIASDFVGECVGAVVSGMMALPMAIKLITEHVNQDTAASDRVNVVLINTPIKKYEKEIGEGFESRLRNNLSNDWIVVETKNSSLQKLKTSLASKNITYRILGISSGITEVTSNSVLKTKEINVSSPGIDFYSCSIKSKLDFPTVDHFKSILSECANFDAVISDLYSNASAEFIDLSTDAFFYAVLNRAYGKSNRHLCAFDRFSKDVNFTTNLEPSAA